jgi:hypothetical protein
MTKFEVYSQHYDERYPEGQIVTLEVTRTDRKTAESDAELLKSVTGRKAWVEETNS